MINKSSMQYTCIMMYCQKCIDVNFSAAVGVSDDDSLKGNSPDHVGGHRRERRAPMEEDPKHHRLQRQDAKSRKTFKIKRQRSTIKDSIRFRTQPPRSIRVRHRGMAGAGANESEEEVHTPPETVEEEETEENNDAKVSILHNL